MRPSRPAIGFVVAALACCGRTLDHHRPLQRLPPLGRSILVLAPHPDDEVLGAAAVIDAARRSGAQVHVLVATDGERGPDKTGAPDLGEERREETRRALGDLGLGADAVTFLGYADGSLAGSWGNGWTAVPRAGGSVSADAVVDALRAALRGARPDTVVLPIAVDAHPDHRALNRFALLALLGEADRLPVLGYLIHAKRWPSDAGDPRLTSCAGALFRWDALSLSRAAVERKTALIETYRTQVGHSRRLLHFANPIEPFAREDATLMPQAMGLMRPGVQRTSHRIIIRVPRGPCVADPDASDRLRLRFFGAGGVEDRVIGLDRMTVVEGGRPGRPPAPAHDVLARTTGASIRLQLAATTFGNITGAVLEVLPGSARRIGPAWVLLW